MTDQTVQVVETLDVDWIASTVLFIDLHIILRNPSLASIFRRRPNGSICAT